MDSTIAEVPDRSDASQAAGREATRLRDISPQQWRSGIAAWLGWLFDGLDMHLYTLVATPFVAQLLAVGDLRHPDVGYYGSVIGAVLGAAMLAGGLTILMLDLGRPDRFVVAATNYNPTSVFAWNIVLYSGMFSLTAVYLWTMMERRMNRLTRPAGFIEVSRPWRSIS